ncbi:hypothetical protein PORY_001465 [Pneumocystis oryctolagi]|uniref:Uncharacterized protein n=1 Tax=Pneumocystis oryctolagi TaxID=42067 RepID=A0ACB7CD40_9ASCO|nr:hypothetical protein PORY_001465 [Pneumocystis oryctolagi]
MSNRYIFQKQIKEISFMSNKSFKLFLKKAYPILKKHNPYVPILIREAVGITPTLWIRYEYGREKSISLEGLSEKECEERLNSLLFDA